MKILLLFFLLSAVFCQNVGTQKAEYHLPFPYTECTDAGCDTKKGSITLDQNWRWVHDVKGYTNCFTGVEWDKNLCPDPQTCTRNCAIDGVPYSDWSNPYGTHETSGGIQMNLVTHGQYGDNVGARVYLLQNENQYKMFKLLNREFSFDVDVSKLQCGINGALYFVQMLQDGGSSKYPGNKAGAKYGTGYCDAQCPHDIKFVYGEANSKDWYDDQGYYGSCCAQFDVWQANNYANAYTAHPCKTPGYYRCEGKECGDGDDRQIGVCDKDGCDLNPFRNGNQKFYGPGPQFAVDSSRPFKVVTQFITIDGTDNGDLQQIKRFYVQDKKKIEFPNTNISGLGPYNSLTNQNCQNQKKVFGEPQTFTTDGGMKAMGQAMKDGMVLVMSLWDDHAAYMLWLDSDYPLDANPNDPGVKRGPCPRDSGKPWQVEKKYPDSWVEYYHVRFGTIGSTVKFESDGITLKEQQASLKTEIS